MPKDSSKLLNKIHRKTFVLEYDHWLTKEELTVLQERYFPKLLRQVKPQLTPRSFVVMELYYRLLVKDRKKFEINGTIPRIVPCGIEQIKNMISSGDEYEKIVNDFEEDFSSDSDY